MIYEALSGRPHIRVRACVFGVGGGVPGAQRARCQAAGGVVCFCALHIRESRIRAPRDVFHAVGRSGDRPTPRPLGAWVGMLLECGRGRGGAEERASAEHVY